MKNIVNSQLSVISYDSIDKINEEEWNKIVDDNHIVNKYEYLKAIEYSNIPNFKYFYYMFYKDDKLIAHSSIGIITFTIDFFAKGLLRKVFNFIEKFYPNFLKLKLIECGPSTALGPSIIVTDNDYINEICYLLDKELIKLAKYEKTSFILFRDFYTFEKKDYDILLNYGYKQYINYPNTFFNNNYKSFDDYLKDLSKERRHIIHKRIKTFNEAGCVVEKITDFSNISGELADLWYNTYKHAKEFQREILYNKYFLYMSDFLKEKSFVLVFKKDNIIIGFVLILELEDSLISLYCGLDYNVNKDYSTYFLFYYKTIEEAIKLEKKTIEFGITNYNPKIELGAFLVPAHAYIKSINIFFNFGIKSLLAFITSTGKLKERNTFHSHIENSRKTNLNGKFDCIYNKNKYLIKRFDFVTKIFDIEIEDKNQFHKSRFTVTLKPQDDFAIETDVKIIKKTSVNSRIIYTLEICKINNEFLSLFYYYNRIYCFI